MTQEEKLLSYFLEQLKRHSPADGVHRTLINNLGIIQISTPHVKAHTFYEPALMFVAQGSKFCYLGDKVYDYSAGQLLSMFLPMPVETEITEASPEKPFMAAGIAVDLDRLTDVLIRIDRVDHAVPQATNPNPSGIFASPISKTLLLTLIRLFETLDSERDATVLGEMIMDEVYYHILCNEQGGDLRTVLQQRGQIQRISRAVDYIHQNLDKTVSVDHLAELVSMSRTSFHENFKAVMHVSPLQYTKSVKLYQAQRHLLAGKNANEAGYLVGYNSPAQFSREYKRHFGYSPSATHAHDLASFN